MKKLMILPLFTALLVACQVNTGITSHAEAASQETATVSGSGNSVSVTPDPLVAGRYAQIEYSGTLADDTGINLHYGFNDWNNVSDSTMVYDSYNECWRISISIPADATSLDFVFFNGVGEWDNNNGNDWHITVLTDVSSVEINPATGIVPELEILDLPVQLIQSGTVIQESNFSINGTILSAYFDVVDFGTYTVSMDADSNGYNYSGETMVTVDSTHTEHVNLVITKSEIETGALDLIPSGITPAIDLLGMSVQLVENGTVAYESEFVLDGSSYITARFDELNYGTYTAILDTIKDNNHYSGSAEITIDSTYREYIYMDIAVMPIANKIIHYSTDWSSTNMHYIQENGNWTTAPGITMNDDGDGWFSLSVEVTGELEFCFNNGTEWDSKNGTNYHSSLEEIWVKNGTIYDEKPVFTTSFYATANNIPYGYTMEIRGNRSPLSWTQGIELNGSGTNRYITLVIDGPFEYKYTLIDENGSVIWEILEGNNIGTQGTGHYDFPTF
jgi:hypothetical protein